ncbi:MAG: hypothetical protein ACLUI0_12055 [Blautia massiliensis (ex Durand et al. 2017)]
MIFPIPEENDDFSSGETEQALAGILDDSLETQMTREKVLLLKQTSRYLLPSLPHVQYIKATTWRVRIIPTGLHLWNLILLQVRMDYLMRVQSGAIDGKILIEYYDSGYNLKKTMTLDLPLPEFGGFYETNDNYYILTGQEQSPNKTTVKKFTVSANIQKPGSL